MELKQIWVLSDREYKGATVFRNLKNNFDFGVSGKKIFELGKAGKIKEMQN
jgi:hypothetical protein